MLDFLRERLEYIHEYIVCSEEENHLCYRKEEALQYIHYIEGFIDGLDPQINREEE